MIVDKCIKVYGGIGFEEAAMAVKFFVEKTLPEREAAGIERQLGSGSAVWVDLKISDKVTDHLMVYETKTMYVVRRYHLVNVNEVHDEVEQDTD